MGIPSFYRHLCKSCPYVISSEIPRVEWLFLDFNCAIYFVLHKFKLTNPNPNRVGWEADLIKEVILYLEEIIHVADPEVGVFVSVDGAVCAAKRRQQRLRRFKSDPTATWDQNAITPGSNFMSMLNRELKAAAVTLSSTSAKRIVITGSDEPGEGEHKIMRFVRGEGLTGSLAIYGLDADLILLSMLLQADTGCSISLLREAQEFEKGADSRGWRSLNINALQKALFGGGASDTRRTRDFVCAMSLLGNDFLPRSLTHTVRDQGIPDLLKILDDSVWSKGFNLITADNRVSIYGLLRIVSLWAHNEQVDLLGAVQRAQKAANYPTFDEESEKNSLPAKWATITQILPHLHSQESWMSFYESWHPGTTANYLLGVAWIWDYYSGASVDQAWNFEEHLPPTWSALEHELIRMLNDSGEGEGVLEPPVILYPSPLPEKLHLLSVLPMTSIEKLLPPEFVTIAHQFPWYWPTSWGVHDVGKTQLWECEPVIPLIPELLLRSFVC